MLTLFNDSVITWLLTCVCAPQCMKNPYVTAKLVEVLFVISSNAAPNSGLQISVSINVDIIFVIIIIGLKPNINSVQTKNMHVFLC